MTALNPRALGFRLSAAGVGLLLGLLTRDALAQQMSVLWYNYRNVPQGGRTATMGGAGIAFGTDSAMPLLNPAGLAAVSQHRISMSATAYSLQAVRVDNYFTADMPASMAGYVSADTTRTQTFVAFPSGFVYSWPFGPEAGKPGHQVVSLSIVTPRQYNDEWKSQYGRNVNGSRTMALSTLTSNIAAYYFGPTYAVQLTPRIRLGVGMLGLYTRLTETNSMSRLSSDGADSTQQTYIAFDRGNSYALVPVLGIQTNPFGNFHAGASLQVQSLPLAGNFEWTRTLQTTRSLGRILDYGGSGFQTDTSTVKADRFQVLAPYTIGVGIGYEVPHSWAIALDGLYFHSIEYALYSGSVHTSSLSAENGIAVVNGNTEQRVRGDAILDISLGGELFMSDSLALRAGVFTDMSPSPKIVLSDTSEQQFSRRVHMIGGSLGLGVYAGPVDFTVGAVYEGGAGKFGAAQNSFADRPYLYRVSDATESRLTFVITGGVSFGKAFAPIDNRFQGFETPEELLDAPGAFLPGMANGPPAPSIPEPLPASTAPSSNSTPNSAPTAPASQAPTTPNFPATPAPANANPPPTLAPLSPP